VQQWFTCISTDHIFSTNQTESLGFGRISFVRRLNGFWTQIPATDSPILRTFSTKEHNLKQYHNSKHITWNSWHIIHNSWQAFFPQHFKELRNLQLATDSGKSVSVGIFWRGYFVVGLFCPGLFWPRTNVSTQHPLIRSIMVICNVNVHAIYSHTWQCVCACVCCERLYMCKASSKWLATYGAIEIAAITLHYNLYLYQFQELGDPASESAACFQFCEMWKINHASS